MTAPPQLHGTAHAPLAQLWPLGLVGSDLSLINPLSPIHVTPSLNQRRPSQAIVDLAPYYQLTVALWNVSNRIFSQPSPIN